MLVSVRMELLRLRRDGKMAVGILLFYHLRVGVKSAEA